VGLIVQKFGGSSVANAERIKRAATRAVRAKRQGNRVIVVVSARGDTTDELIELAREISEDPPRREMDMLLSTGEQQSVALMAMAVDVLGEEAISFAGAQIGIVTDSFHTKAKIKNIDPTRIVEALDAGKVVIVAGFQGIDENLNITTLGRGGSDTTAVALAAALKADVCEIYTDVDGVYTADPRKVLDARKINRISYDEMLELASLGAQVMQARSIEYAKRYGVDIHVRSSFNDNEGTRIVREAPEMESIVVSGVALSKNEAKVTFRGVPDRPGVAAMIMGRFAVRGVNVDMIVQNTSADGVTDMSLTVERSELSEAKKTAQALMADLGGQTVEFEEAIAKLSVVGIGMRSHTGVAEKMFAALAAENVNIKMISTSEIKISVIIDANSADRALAAVHKAFELHKAPA
jgi:aspartate kinase